jgi:hypothetical protein
VTVRAEPRRREALRSLVGTRVGAGALVGVLIAAAFVARVLLARYVVAPWIMPDEDQYALVARSFVSTGHYLFRDHPQHVPSVYPALVSPAWLASSVKTGYLLVKTVNCGLMTLGAVPLYLWARRLVPPLWGALAVTLYLAMPAFIYTDEILTENAYVPAVILALFAIAVAIERPTLVTQLLALGAVGLAMVARLQGVVLLLVLPTAIGLVLVFDAVAAAPGERRGLVAARLRRFWPSLGGLALALVAYVVYESSRGGALSSGFGVYQEVSNAHYSFVTVLRWLVYHFGELSFAVALLPLSALIVLIGLACRRATAPPPAQRAFLAVAAPAVFWIVLEAAAFASHFSLRVEERYMFNVFPVLFLALAVWLAEGLPRPPGLTAAAVLVPVAFLLALPLESLISSGGFISDTFSLIPLWRLTTLLSGGAADVRILLGVGAFLAAFLFSSLPRAWARVAVPGAVLGFLVLASGSVFAQVSYVSQGVLHAGGLAGDPSWIDRAVGRHSRVEFLYTTDIDANQHVLYQAEFWNRSVRRVYGVNVAVPSYSDVTAPLDPATGRIVPQLPASSPDVRPSYVVAASNVNVAGAPLAHEGLLALYRVHQPLRLASVIAGVTPDSWTSSSASYTRYVGHPSGAHIVVAVSRPPLEGPPPATVTATVGRLVAKNGMPLIGKVWERRTWLLHNNDTHHFDLPLRSGPFQVQLSVSPTFVPSQYGLADTRTLGVQVSFSVP